MNVFVYLSLVTLAGLVLSFVVGQKTREINGLAATFLFLGVSIGIGFGLTFPVLMIVSKICHSLGIASKSCIATDDRTVWFLAAPFVFFPAYIISMFVGRASR